MTLESFFTENPIVALGFSGGVDSSYLLYAAKKYGADIRPYYVKTAFQPGFELADAYKTAGEIGVNLTVLELEILENGNVAANPNDRCYYCKTAIFAAISERAKKDGIPLITDGTNASDDVNDRPGMKALYELGVRSPLKECGLTKSDIRLLSKEAGLFTWEKPAYACLATRIPYGMPLTKELLARVERAEDALFSLGFADFRVRVLGNMARLQFTQGQTDKAIRERTQIIKSIKPYFDGVLLDLEGR